MFVISAPAIEKETNEQTKTNDEIYYKLPVRNNTK